MCPVQSAGALLSGVVGSSPSGAALSNFHLHNLQEQEGTLEPLSPAGDTPHFCVGHFNETDLRAQQGDSPGCAEEEGAGTDKSPTRATMSSCISSLTFGADEIHGVQLL